MKRNIGINLNCYRGGLSVDRQIELMKDNGFTSCFTGSENSALEYITEAIAKAGITMDNYHAPFNKINDIWSSGEEGDEMLRRLLVSVENCEKYGVPALVVHLSSGVKPPRIGDAGLDRFSLLMESAEKHNVKICYENQRMLGNLSEALEIFPEARFCWDTGHEACFTLGRRYMPLFGKRLSALHIHDNHGEFNKDEHLIPGDGTINFKRVAQSISESGYTGTIMLEILRDNSHYYDETSPEEYYSRAAEAARKLRDACDTFDLFV